MSFNVLLTLLCAFVLAQRSSFRCLGKQFVSATSLSDSQLTRVVVVVVAVCRVRAFCASGAQQCTHINCLKTNMMLFCCVCAVPFLKAEIIMCEICAPRIPAASISDACLCVAEQDVRAARLAWTPTLRDDCDHARMRGMYEDGMLATQSHSMRVSLLT